MALLYNLQNDDQSKGCSLHVDIVILCPEVTRPSFVICMMKVLSNIFSGSLRDKKIVILQKNELSMLYTLKFKVLYNFKVYGPELLPVFVQCKNESIPIIFETDDNFGAIEYKNNMHIHHEHNDDNYIHAIQYADITFVYSQSSAKYVSRHTGNTVILPTYQERRFHKLPVANNSNKVIGFMGSLKKDHDWEFVTPALLKLLYKHPEVKLEFFGFIPEQLKMRPSVTHMPFLNDYDTFISILKSRGWTIGLAPLCDTLFNRSKTNNKYREYASIGFPGIYSNIPPYIKCVKDKFSGLLVENTRHAWYKAIVQLLNDETLRNSIRNNAFIDINTNYNVKNYVAVKRVFLKIFFSLNWHEEFTLCMRSKGCQNVNWDSFEDYD